MSHTPNYSPAVLYALPVSIAAFGAVISLLGCALGVIYVATFGIAVLFLASPFVYRAVSCRYAYHIVERDGFSLSRDQSAYSADELDFVIERIGISRKEMLRISLDRLVSVTSGKEKAPPGGAEYVYSLDRWLAVRLVFEDGGETVAARCDIGGSAEMTSFLTATAKTNETNGKDYNHEDR